MKRLPKNYNGNQITSHKLKDLLNEFLIHINKKLDENLLEIKDVWVVIVGSKISKMSRIINFNSGVLKIQVENSTLYSLLAVHEKVRLLSAFRKKLPNIVISDILFFIG